MCTFIESITCTTLMWLKLGYIPTWQPRIPQNCAGWKSIYCGLERLLHKVLILGGWEMRRLLISQSASLKTNCTYHETVSSNRSPQRGLAVCSHGRVFPVWGDCGPAGLISDTCCPSWGALLVALSSKAEDREHSPKKNQKCGQMGLVAWLAGSSTWGAGAGPSRPVSCAGGPQHSSWQWPITCKAVSDGWEFPSLPTTFSPFPNSITRTPNHIIKGPLNLCAIIYKLFQTYFGSYPSLYYYSENHRLS